MINRQFVLYDPIPDAYIKIEDAPNGGRFFWRVYKIQDATIFN